MNGSTTGPTPASPHPPTPGDTDCWWLFIRRNRTTGELAYYRCYSPHRVSLGELVRVAGRRWTVEEAFQASKELTGLDQHQVRRWISWHRGTLPAMLAHALLAVIAADERHQQTSDGLSALTCNKVRRLFMTLVVEPLRTRACPIAW